MSTKEVTRLDVNVSQAVCHWTAHSSGVRIPRSDLSVLNFTRSLASVLWLHLIVAGSKVLFDVLQEQVSWALAVICSVVHHLCRLLLSCTWENDSGYANLC